VTWSAELRFYGEYGVEAQILRNGHLSIARTFVLWDLAVGWAKNEREASVTLLRPRHGNRSCQALRRPLRLFWHKRRDINITLAS
jgi:hypothetical protein